MGPDAAMVFAAGFGTRMGALTKDRPKPMIHVAGKPLLDHALDLTRELPLKRTVVNTHYLSDQISNHLSSADDITVLHEKDRILDTGGGLKNALSYLDSETVFTLNTDTIWTGSNPLETLLRNWVPELMDALLILIPRENAKGHRGCGDFNLSGAGALHRRGNAPNADYVFGGAQIIRTAKVANVQETEFSLNLVWEQMLKADRVFGAVHHGGWVDVGTPHGILTAEAELAKAADV